MNFINDFFVTSPTGAFIIISAFIGVLGIFAVQRYIAYTKLSSAFSDVIVELEGPTRTSEVRGILIREFSTHSKAIVIFRDNLNWFSKYRLKKAWQQYHSSHCFDADGWGIPKEDQLFLDCFSIEDQAEAAKIYLNRIHKILSIAKFT